MSTVDRLYEAYNIISDDKANALQHEAEYIEILEAVKGGAGERRLASQFITCFFPLFPSLQEQALNAQFDLCEDEDTLIRKQAIKELPVMCREKKELVPKVADILAQLLQMDDHSELAVVQKSLNTLFDVDTKGTLTGLLYQIQNNSDETVKERCLQFLLEKVKTSSGDILTVDLQNIVVAEGKKILKDASEDEFLLVMSILKHLKVTKSLKGYQQMVDLVADKCGIGSPLNPSDTEALHRLVTCVRQAMPFFSSQIRSSTFVDYIFSEIVPYLGDLDTSMTENSESASSSLSLEILKILSELMPYSEDLSGTLEKLEAIFMQLLVVVPLPPSSEEATENLEAGVTLEFSRVECLLFIFHRLARNHQEFLADNEERLKDFRMRLQYFARGSQAYQKKLKESIKGKTSVALNSPENKIKLIALKTTKNINTLIRDLFHPPPLYKSNITLSWKENDKSLSNGDKRHAPITFDSSHSKTAKQDVRIYSPPKDKFSKEAGYFGGRGRGFRGGFNRRGGRGMRRGFRSY